MIRKTYLSRIIVKPLPAIVEIETKMDDGFMKSLTVSELEITDSSRGEVIKIGPDVHGVEIGEIVHYAKRGALKIKHDSEDFEITTLEQCFFAE